MKKLFLIGLFVFNCVRSEQPSAENFEQINICAISNHTDDNIVVKATKPFEIIITGKTKKVLTRGIFLVPFISIEKDIIDFVRNDFYIPKSALKIKTKFGKISLWQYQQGVTYALKKNDEKNEPVF